MLRLALRQLGWAREGPRLRLKGNKKTKDSFAEEGVAVRAALLTKEAAAAEKGACRLVGMESTDWPVNSRRSSAGRTGRLRRRETHIATKAARHKEHRWQNFERPVVVTAVHIDYSNRRHIEHTSLDHHQWWQDWIEAAVQCFVASNTLRTALAEYIVAYQNHNLGEPLELTQEV